MKRQKLIQELLSDLPWDDFFIAMQNVGFVKLSKIDPNISDSKNKIENCIHSGNVMLVNDILQSASIRDASHLHFLPQVIFRPVTEYQLQKIVIHSQKYQIPLTFASGKTGLSGAYANYAIVVDLADLHSLPAPFTINLESKKIEAEQGVIISDLIKWIEYKSDGVYIWPIQPSSALKLPVRVGGIISTNASGLTSGKLGATEDWVETIRIMKPSGEIISINKDDPLFFKIIGGEGMYGIVLSATFKLRNVPKNTEQAILYGSDEITAFEGLTAVQNQQIFPLISEFIMSPSNLIGKFKNLPEAIKNNQTINWIVLIKGEKETLNDFIRVMKKYTELRDNELSDSKFKELLNERASLPLLSVTGDRSANILRIPSFEDILVDPIVIPGLLDALNEIYKEKGLEKVSIGYGHLNFRKGQGALFHVRLPVPIMLFYENKEENLGFIAETSYEVISFLKKNYHIKHKAEHGSGPFKFWLDSTFRESLKQDIKDGKAFYNPHLEIYNKILQNKMNAPKRERKSLPNKEKIEEPIEKELFVECMYLYLAET